MCSNFKALSFLTNNDFQKQKKFKQKMFLARDTAEETEVKKYKELFVAADIQKYLSRSLNVRYIYFHGLFIFQIV